MVDKVPDSNHLREAKEVREVLAAFKTLDRDDDKNLRREEIIKAWIAKKIGRPSENATNLEQLRDDAEKAAKFREDVEKAQSSKETTPKTLLLRHSAMDNTPVTKSSQAQAINFFTKLLADFEKETGTSLTSIQRNIIATEVAEGIQYEREIRAGITREVRGLRDKFVQNESVLGVLTENITGHRADIDRIKKAITENQASIVMPGTMTRDQMTPEDRKIFDAMPPEAKRAFEAAMAGLKAQGEAAARQHLKPQVEESDKRIAAIQTTVREKEDIAKLRSEIAGYKLVPDEHIPINGKEVLEALGRMDRGNRR